nr:type III-B CRISPR module RAMP protein Cmr1 [Ardenticatena sp.]
MTTLRIDIRTRTPLWTGGLDGTMDRIHETGLIGSLRWWYEAIVRGLGGWACDPIGDDRCPDHQGRYCDVCAVFGATGLQRAFRLEGPVWWNGERHKRLTVKVGDRRNHRGWYLGRGCMGPVETWFVPLRLPKGWSQDDLWEALHLTLRLIACWGGLGARTQQGYGVVEVEGGAPPNLDGWKPWPQQRSNRRNIQHHPDWPSLDGFFFAKVRFSVESQSPQDWIRERAREISPDDELDWYLHQTNSSQQRAVLPLAPIVRYHLRGLMHPNRPPTSMGYSTNTRHRLMGELRQKSLIHVSHAYQVNSNQWEFRIWGWIPESLPNDVSRSDVLTDLKSWMDVSQQRQWHSAQNGQLWQYLKNMSNPKICWFEKGANENTGDYLKALLQCHCKEEGHGQS